MDIYEKDIEDAFVRSVDSGMLGDWQLKGRQVVLENGKRLDVLLARGKERMVVEVKREKADASALVQLLGYMSYVRREENVDAVQGVLVAQSVTREVEEAISALDHVRFFEARPKVSFFELFCRPRPLPI